MTKCKNCGHEIIQSKVWNELICGCTNPEPESKTMKYSKCGNWLLTEEEQRDEICSKCS